MKWRTLRNSSVFGHLFAPGAKVSACCIADADNYSPMIGGGEPWHRCGICADIAKDRGMYVPSLLSTSSWPFPATSHGRKLPAFYSLSRLDGDE